MNYGWPTNYCWGERSEAQGETGSVVRSEEEETAMGRVPNLPNFLNFLLQAWTEPRMFPPNNIARRQFYFGIEYGSYGAFALGYEKKTTFGYGLGVLFSSGSSLPFKVFSKNAKT
jgi:hypothetical protein